MNKRRIGCAIVAALLGGGLVWAADHRTAEGIDGWETLNTGMAQALGVEEGADAVSAGKTEGSADPAGAGGNDGAAAAVVSSGTAEAAGSSETVNGSDSPGAGVNGEAVKDSDAAGTGVQGTAGGGGADAAGTAGSTAAAADGSVNVNTADAAALMDLPGIGEKKAQAIIDYRSSKGVFRSLADLGKVKGIGPKMLEKLEGLVIFN